MSSHNHTPSLQKNRKAELAKAYNELGKELSSSNVRVVGNYTLGRVIGQGAYGKVRLGTHRLTSTRVAIKQIPKAMSASLTREIHHHRQLHHPHVTQMYEVIATESHIWIVTELCCGGELFDYLVEKGRLSEDETRLLFGQLCLAVAYLHDNNIVHRDLKLENVLLDERCRVKLGDFGFTREFDPGVYMETFCGTTGYAAPEMLQGKKYQGPEVDVWSLGIILYTLLTGTLPFDDDEEAVMRQKIIQGEFEDPTWLSIESRNLLKKILVKDVTKRFTIPQILADPWFTSPRLTYEPELSPFSPPISSERPSTPDNHSRRNSADTAPESSEASIQESSPFTDQPELASSTPTTPDHSVIIDPFESLDNDVFKNQQSIRHHPSNSTIRRGTDVESLSSKFANSQPATVIEEEDVKNYRCPSPVMRTSSSQGPPLPVRTPARTKRRSVSSIMTETGSPIGDKTPTPLPTPSSRDVDFMSMLMATAPVMFSTPAERRLLNTLASLGFDTAQLVHSVLSYACDSAGALWWMLRKKEERMVFEEMGTGVGVAATTVDTEGTRSDENSGKKKRRKTNAGVQTENVMAPQFAFVPPTPTGATRPTTPPQRTGTPVRSPLLSPTSSGTCGDLSSKSHPSTPSGSLKDREKDQLSKGRKARAGSVSIMQRATTALEAAGLVRKKSAEIVRDEKDKSRDATDRRRPSNEEPSRLSHGSASSKLTKSPPLRPTLPPSTPPPSDHHKHSGMGSPWILADGREVASTSAIAAINAKGEMLHSNSTPNISDTTTTTATMTTPKATATAPARNKSNLLATFRLWFNEERKGRRKEDNGGNNRIPSRRNSGKFTAGTRGRHHHRAQRPSMSMSSHRSSSVNSRRSSFHSAHNIVKLESPIQARKSMGSHTPTSDLFGGEREHFESRPSSIQSFSMTTQTQTQTQRHRKSPSQSSAGSIHHLRTSSPSMQQKHHHHHHHHHHHRRGGSGSSTTTRVVRQITPVSRSGSMTLHARSNSATSSLHSPVSSRPTSFYEIPSENEGVNVNVKQQRTESSPYRNKSRSRRRRSTDGSSVGSSRRGSTTISTTTSTFVAQRRQGPFASPAARSNTTSSWKKSWGIEPPGWSSRTAQNLTIEVIDISSSSNHHHNTHHNHNHEPMSIRDVFSSKQTIHVGGGDESDWVDEDEDVPILAGGLGQLGTTLTSISNHQSLPIEPQFISLSPAPRGHRMKRNNNNARSSTTAAASVAATGGIKSGRQSPTAKSTGLGSDFKYEGGGEGTGRVGRRQLPAGRTGPAFRHAIQEEDEGEEE